ncbi:MAG: DUF5686 and carboxypeptidase regulatory-like domain-containing protein [Imperialibacter sp.]|uniref:DUF5686 and carboxypeptidase regulatory-like domain-containing protein n=1 Tax=Imperialibacter sp. TaxID=2038411 RepID=UPI003A854635
MRYFYSLSLLLLVSFTALAQNTGIKGKVLGENNEPLPFATIFIRNINTGTTSNVEGDYEVRLAPGKYDVVFQYIGYESNVHFFEVTTGFETYNLTLKPRIFLLKEVEVRSGKEDPAYTIMRKAIGKASFHANQLDAYDAKVYMKGSGRLLDSPFFLRNKIAEEGIDSTTAFTSESVSELHYERPSTYSQKVVAVFSQGEDNGTGPGEFLTASFYEPKVVDAISPLSPKAFAYYRFTYDGYFREGGYVINKILVTPRSKGDDIFEGTIYIVDDLWSIHSLDFTMYKLGIKFNIEQVYNPIEDKAWLPVSHKFVINGSFFGFDFQYNYLATLSEYKITLNPDLDIPVTVIDEKIDKEVAAEVKQKTKGQETLEKLAQNKEVTRKDLRKLVKEYEKEEMEDLEFPEIVSNISIKRDSTTSYNNDSTFWTSMRPVPLTAYEIRGYTKIDSLDKAEEAEYKSDTTKKGKNRRDRKVRVTDPILGNSYKLGEKSRLNIESPLETIGFNTVEGFNFFYDINYSRRFENGNKLQFGPMLRYSFAREKLLPKGYVDFQYGENGTRGSARLEAGSYVQQLSALEPIHPYINTAYALLFKESYLKLYEKDFVRYQNEKRYSDKFFAKAGLEYAQRRSLANNSDFTFFKHPGKEFTANNPLNANTDITGFFEHQALTFNISGEYKPWLKYRMKNGSKEEIRKSTPTFTLEYRKGMPWAESDVNYDLLDVGVKHSFEWGIRSKLDVRVNAGKFLNDKAIYFPDFKHFPGNQTLFATLDPVENFRLLDYYYYSTNDEYVTAFVHNQWRKLVVTQMAFVRMMGIKENMFINYLGTPNSNNYTEVGYGLDYIMRVFRLEAIAAFEDGQYKNFGVRIGIATNLEDLFDF